MEKKYWLVIKDNYVIDYIVWDGITPYVYPFPHDFLKENITGPAGSACIGDWYEESEDIFYRPLSTPPDFPLIF
jgi:hypothetical protein